MLKDAREEIEAVEQVFDKRLKKSVTEFDIKVKELADE